jgi:hypothetical protein
MKTKIDCFKDLVENKSHSISPDLENAIDNKSFPFKDNIFFSYNPAKLAAEEFNRCAALYDSRTPNGTAMDAMQMMAMIMSAEQEHKEDLESLAIELVREMYNVPESLDLKAMLKMSNTQEECAEQEDEDEISEERKAELLPEIEKRRILNSIVHGVAVYQWTSAYYIVSEKLNDIDPELISKYNKVSALVNYWNWKYYFEPMINAGQMPVLQGINKVKVKEREIEASAINFPVLIHELSKGVVDYLITIGLPDLPESELRYIYNEADKYSHEQYHYCFGPTLWRSMLETADVGSEELPPIISEMAKMTYEELSDFCIDLCFFKETRGKKAMSFLKKVL